MSRPAVALALLAAPVYALAAWGQNAAITPGQALSVRGGRFVDRDGKSVVLFGVNLFQSHLHWSRRQDPKDYQSELKAIAEQGFNAVRMPLNMSWFEPRRGVFPDDPSYDDILRSHRLPTGAVAFYDGLIDRAGELGIYVIPEFHELPADPYRWFVGGEERDRKTGRPGRAIAWLRPDKTGKGEVDWDLVRQEIPRALAWMAAHWKGRANIAGIEIPWNEPGGPLTEPQAFFDLSQACAVAVKQADPERLVFMNCVDWGAMVNNMPDESVWKLPPQVDALFPHFYPGLHTGNSGEDGTWRASMASWASWMAGSGRPVMVGEYGVVEMHRATYWKQADDRQRANSFNACLAQWHAMGVQGAFCWAWDKGIGRNRGQGLLNQGAAEIRNWAAAYRHETPALAEAQVAVVCAPNKRAQYGGRKDLWAITDAMLAEHLTPFATIFPSQVAAQPGVLNRYAAVLVYDNSLPGRLRDRLAERKGTVLWLSADLANLPEMVKAARDAVAPTTVQPANVIVAYASGQVTLYERLGKPGQVTLKLRLPGAWGEGRLVADDGETVARGPAYDLATKGIRLELKAWQCLVLRWVPASD